MSFWRRSDHSILRLVVLGLIQVPLAALDLYGHGAGSLGWMRSASLAVVFLAAAPLDDPPRRDWPLRQQLRTWNGLVAAGALIALLGLILWPRIIHG